MDTREITMGAAEDIALVKQTLQTSMGEEEMLKVRRWLYPDGKHWGLFPFPFWF